MSTEVTAAVVCALATGALASGFAKDRDAGQSVLAAVHAGASSPESLFAGAVGASDGVVARVARRTARSAPVPPASGTVVGVRRGRSAALSLRPGAPPVAVLGDRTAFGSDTVLAVVRRKPGWLAVLTSALPNGTVGWVRDERSSLTTGRRRVRIVVDRSDQRLDLVRGSRRVMSVAVGVGRPGSETPTGRFAVTDKLAGTRFSNSYGCCILALSGRQSHLPPGWQGGDRLAIHGTDGRSAPSVGSMGCVAVDRAPLERLIRSVPLGTVVTIRP
ncbi:MAG: hypothetical protein QOE06_313 [Thermoleophilaceae bacterium]|nr:hypothetical protein [Thermoleophilaceae bacterium]